jgi:heptosyltransferase III
MIRLRSMGDTVLMTPALRLLRDWRPDLQISVLVERPWNELLENNPALEAVIPLRNKLLTAFEIRRKRFELVINLHGGPTSAFLTRVSGARWRAGFEHFRNSGVYNLHVPKAQQILHRKGNVHTAEHVASSLFWLGAPRTEIPRAQVFASAEAGRGVAAKLSALGIQPNQGYAVIHPTAAYATKQWKPAGFAEVSDYLQREFGLRSVFICGAGELNLVTEVQKHTGQRIVSAAGWPLREVIALIANSRIFVGNDSGPAHIAAAVGVPLLVIFGSSHSAVWRPWTDTDAVVVQNDFDCNPCPGDRCYAYAEPRCILSITPEQVKVCLEGLLLHSAARR